MSAFKAAVARDVQGVFINTKEFGDKHTINGRAVDCVVDGDLLQERPGSQSEGVFLEEIVVFVATSAIEYPPVVGESLRLDGNRYTVKLCVESMGVLEITLTANET